MAMLRRGMAGSWTQFVAVFCMAMLCVLAYTGLEGGWRGMQVSLDDYAKSSSLADAWVQVMPGDMTTATDVSRVNGVTAAEQRLSSAARVDREGKNSWISLTSTSEVDSWRISIPRSVEGDDLTDDGVGIWLSPGYMDAHDLKVGDTINIDSSIGDGELRVVIRGSVLSPDQMYDVEDSVFLVPEKKTFSYGYVTPQTAVDLWGDSWLQDASVEVVVKSDGSEQLVDDLWAGLGDKVVRVSTRDTDAQISPVYDRVRVIRNVSVLFASLFLVVGILAMYSSTKRLVDSELKTIATLQSMGFGHTELRLHFSTFGMVTGIAGSVVGLVLAPVLSRVVLTSQSSQFDLPAWRVAYTFVPLVVVLLVIAACVGGGYLASGSALTRSPALLMRPGLVRASAVAVRLRNLGKGKHWGMRWALRDSASNLIRFTMGIVGVAGCLMLLFTGFGLPDTMQNRAATSFSADSLDYAERLDINGVSTLTAEIEGLGTDPQYMMQLPVLTEPSDGYDRVLTVLDDGDRFRLASTAGQDVEGDGLWVTQDTSERLGLGAGSRVTLNLPKGLGELDCEIAGVITTEMPQGFFISRQGWENEGQVFSPSAILVGSDADPSALLDDSRVGDVVSRDAQQDNALNIKDSLGGIFNLMRVMAIVLCIIVLYSLGSLTFDERKRQYATLSVLGMSPEELRRLSSLEVIISAAFGVLIGIPGGRWFLAAYVTQVENPRLQYTPFITLGSVILAVVIAVSSALVTTVLLGRRIASINMVDALKEAE